MTVLLDTHALVFAVDNPGKLSPTTVAIIRDVENDLVISAITVWELAMLAQKRRLMFDEGVETWTDRALAKLRVRTIPVDGTIFRRTFHLPGFDREDPADRVIVATAVVHDALLVTHDEWMEKWPGVATVG